MVKNGKGKHLGRFLRNRINNLINRSLSRGSFLAIALLMAMTGLIILLGTLILGIWHFDLGTKEDGIINVAWEVLLRAMSPDQLAENQKWPARIILLVITLVGLLLVSTLISILNSVIERRMEFLHRGRGEVHLSNHKVVLS